MKPKNLVIVRAVHEQGLTHAVAAVQYGVTRQWVHTLMRRYEAEGPNRLIHDRDVTVSSMNTSEIIAEFTIDPTRDYQAKKP